MALVVGDGKSMKHLIRGVKQELAWVGERFVPRGTVRR